MDLFMNTTSQEAEHLVVLGGDIDAHTGPKVKETLMSLANQPGASRILVDLEAVEYMDSTGIGIFIAAMKACKQNGCAFEVQKLSPRVERLFRITGLYEHIAVRKGESE
ncbi:MULTISPECIES: anti-sigma factor antagonist [Brevibacillus]|jgi:anti-anti-sigma factor|uniref:Anti-sigma factor antagonist n=1 Tax=Brevibacillus parabrevis TaxID=54914 RepID=A0A4Y3PXB3_BREPA|nr:MULTISPECIES: anti-sigma factor antagonist [Brevibacillus]KZE48424.1 anti-sigma B factor antagonist [Brevibacillus parabrevis]MBU8715660.1 anti-sigma factor antagonist [Brevibacillus parabrevis]MDH6353610.1 anti-sigma B factor antagonist [Brevibacillus sp. 1238]MDR5001761.1 anti-sigma factor antagonist [Brevibacillus parabrevis]MED1721227.1 anti-sigma factor antagonist [Brevibacillus parabrevis]